MKFKFDPRQQFQLDAIDSVVDLFEGQPSDSVSLVRKLRQVSTKKAGDQEAARPTSTSGRSSSSPRSTASPSL